MKLKPTFARASVALALTFALAACDGDDGATGPAGPGRFIWIKW